MNERALFVKFWTDESKTTRNVLVRIPEGSEYRPDPKSRTPPEIAMRRTAAASLIVACAVGIAVSTASLEAQDTGRPITRPRIIVELSDALTHSPLETCAPTVLRAAAGRRPARIATWNIRGARSAPVEALAAELQAMEADIAALQEVDVRTRRGGFVEQPKRLAGVLGFHYVFAASIKWDEGDYGLALVSRWPITDVRRHRIATTPGYEPRIVLETTICADGRPLRIFNHHADGRAVTREVGLIEVLGLLRPHIGRGILVLGDFNEPADAPGVRGLIDAGLVDLAGHDPSGTDSGRIDHVLADGPLASQFSRVQIWPTDKSDHHAVLADLAW